MNTTNRGHNPVLDGGAADTWLPVASSTDLPSRHVYHGQLLGREFAIWRADDGHVNVWENRCLHRGVRLSIGINDGQELVCQYHGWRYANRSAGCTYIPAHPADAPARTICNNTYPAVEQHGLIWSCSNPAGTEVTVPALPASFGPELVLRAMPVNAPLDLVAAQLENYPKQFPDSAASAAVEKLNWYSMAVSLVHPEITGTTRNILFFLQPVDSHRTVIRGVVQDATDDAGRLLLLRQHNSALTRLRQQIESLAALQDTPEPLAVRIAPVSEALAAMPELSTTGRQVPLRVTVASRDTLATDVTAFELKPLSGVLPAFQPGAHIDVQLANGLVRQYSLTNKPGQTDSYRIAVKRERPSTGGSDHLHDHVRRGDVLAVSLPRNNFPLRRDAVRTLLIAGGIGITPLLSMAQALHHTGGQFSLHHFVRDENHRVHLPLLRNMQDSVSFEIGLSADQTRARLEQLLQGYQPATHVYLCGPAPMLRAARDAAERLGWPEDAVHFEFFKNPEVVDSSGSFTIDLARSGLSLEVPAGQSVLQTLRDNSIELPSSCEQGACGTCKVAVLEGQPLHQDVYLNNSERERNDCMMTCVSRAKSARLTLDI